MVSCPSLPAELLESELFGHKKGAFTGAVKDSTGRVAACEGGTLFLDEIGDLPLPLQPKLLRFLQDHEYERIGEAMTRKADVRIVAATSINLQDAVQAGRFRQELYYRLNAFEITLPPLRERREDIPLLAEHFLTFLAAQNHRKCTGFTDGALQILQSHDWPGNVRELRNVIERAVILCHGPQVATEHLPPNLDTGGERHQDRGSGAHRKGRRSPHPPGPGQSQVAGRSRSNPGDRYGDALATAQTI